MAAREIPKSIRASLYIDGKPAEASLKNISQRTQTLRKELNGLAVGTDDWNKKMKELQLHERTLKNIKAEVKGVNGAFGFLKSEIGKLGVLAVGYLGFQFVSEQFQNIISSNAKLSDSIADVRKTTGLSEEAVRRLNKEFKELNTRTSRQELLGLAEVAGKLGISAEKDVLGFVRAADQISVALGKDLGDSEQAINDLGKLTDLFKVKDQFGLEDALLKTGSAINALGAAGTANEGYIVEFSKRLGTIAPAANISIENVIGLAATMDELGQPAEAATTALGQFIIGMGKDLPAFAKVAKMSVRDFSDLLRTDANAALIAVLTQLKSTGAGVQELAAKMGLIGEDGARATAALSALAGGLDKLKTRQALSNDEFAKGTSLTNEFNIKNNNLASTLEKISKWFYGVATSGIISDTLAVAANGFARLIGVVRTHSEQLERERIELNKLELQITSTNTKEEDRIKLINELKSQYPKLLENLDAEKASNYEIAKAIKAVNDQLVNKIILAKKDEEIADENENTAKIRLRLLETEDKIREKLVKLREQFPDFELPNGTDAEKLSALVTRYREIQNQKGKSTGGIFDPTFGVGKLMRDFEALSAFVGDSKNKTGKMIDARNELIKRLGIDDSKLGTGNTKSTTVKRNFTPGPTKEQLDAYKKDEKEQESAAKNALKEFEKLGDAYKNLNLQRLNDQLSANEKEVKQEEDKFQKLIDEEEKFLLMKGATPKQKEATATNIKQLEADKEKAIIDLRARQEEDLFIKIRDLRTQLTNIHETELQKQKDQINKFYNDLEKDNAGNETLLSSLREQRLIELGNAEIREKENFEKEKLAIEEKYATISGNKAENYIAGINKKYDDEILALKEKFSKELQATKEFKDAVDVINTHRDDEIAAKTKATELDKKNFAIEMAQLASDTAFTIMSNNNRAKSDANLSQIEKQRNAELSNKELTESQKAAINAKYNERVSKEKERAWKSEQRASIAQALINGALAVTKVMAQTGVLSPFVIPGIIAGTAAQIAVIASQKMPQFATGGFSDSDPAGYVGQATIFRRSSSGRPFMAGEAGREWIAPNWMLQDSRFANIIGMLEAARMDKRSFAAGGMTGPAAALQPQYNFGRLEAMLAGFIDTQSKLNTRQYVMPVHELDRITDDRERISFSLDA